MKQILCAVDFSESSGKVLEVAAEIANACGARLIVLFPYRLIDHNHHGDMTSLKAKLESQAREKFTQLRKTIPDLAKASCEFLPEIGFMADRISAHARINGVDMVIISQQQADSSNDIKSINLQNLIRSLQLPFVIVPAEVNAEANIN